MRRIFAFFLMSFLVLGLVGCDLETIDDETTCDAGMHLVGTECVEISEEPEEPEECSEGYKLEDDVCVLEVVENPLEYIEAGMYLVNTDIEPGVYQLESTGFFGGYWERTSGLGGTLSEIIANDNFEGITYVEIKSTDVAFELTSGKMIPIEDVTFEMATGVIEEGTYLVGKSIEAGNYKFTLDEDSFLSIGYIARLSSVDGEFGSILMNSLPSGTTYVEISETDYAFEFTGGTLEKVNIEDLPTETEGVYDSGMYLVGTEINPGIYKVENTGTFGGYWERLSGLTGSFDEIIANENIYTTGYVEILSTDVAINLTDCRLTAIENVTLETLEGEISEGMYLVGDEITPGTYRFTLDPDSFTGFGYWARLSGVTGEFDEIIANDTPSGDIYVEILATDYAFEFSGGTLTKVE